VAGGAAAVTVDRVAAVERLPGLDDQDPHERLAMAFLVGYPANSARAYLGDLKAWGAWCAATGVHPLDARRHHVDAWVRVLQSEPLLARRQHRRLSARARLPSANGARVKGR